MDGQPTHERILYSNINRGGRLEREARPLPAGAPTAWPEPAREIPVYAHCDVLVVGGGPSGTAAAVAAAREGADVLLLERYNHLGGLSTGGLVIWIDRMTDWQGQLVIRGFAEELFDRLPADAQAGLLENAPTVGPSFAGAAPAVTVHDLSEFPAPALVVHGEHTRPYYRAVAETVAAAIPRATLRVIPGARHMSIVERPGEIAATLDAFIAGAS